jgi:hypothetical protein
MAKRQEKRPKLTMDGVKMLSLRISGLELPISGLAFRPSLFLLRPSVFPLRLSRFPVRLSGLPVLPSVLSLRIAMLPIRPSMGTFEVWRLAFGGAPGVAGSGSAGFQPAGSCFQREPRGASCTRNPGRKMRTGARQGCRPPRPGRPRSPFASCPSPNGLAGREKQWTLTRESAKMPGFPFLVPPHQAIPPSR